MTTWKEALFAGRHELGRQSGIWPDGSPKVAGEQAASILLAADRVARAGNIPWQWFYPALAVLGYRTFGDRFRVDELYAQSTMDEEPTMFLFDVLAQLAEALDAQGIAVPSSGGALVEAFFGRKDGASNLVKLAAAAWPLLLQARARGEAPTWTTFFKQDPGMADPGQRIIPPDLRPPLPVDPPPLPTVPSVGGDILVWLIGGYIVYQMVK